jgi:predicted DNA-binding transcriptional regulator AlpA
MFTPNRNHAMQTHEVKTTKPAPRRAAPVSADVHPDSLIRIHQIIGLNGLLNIGRSHFYQLIQQGKFPKPTKLGHISLWRAGDVLDAIRRLGGRP